MGLRDDDLKNLRSYFLRIQEKVLSLRDWLERENFASNWRDEARAVVEE